ncbi:MAG: flagellin [Hyphomonadaceae bacterium]|nr:flagellin [Hyphomonadaceae bacterium]
MLSVNTNYSAMIALQNLNATNESLADVQNRINTGLKVSGAKDNGAVFAIAEGQRARVSALSSVTDGINRASSAIDIALAAGTSIGKILQDMKSKAVSAQAQDLTTEQRQAIQADFDAFRAQIDQVANSAQFNGLNLVASGGANLNVLMSDLSQGTTGRQVASTVVAGLAPGLAAYMVGNGSVAAADTTGFTLNGVSIGTVTISATTTVQQYLDAVSTQTGGRVVASYNQSTGQFTYRAAEGVAVTNEFAVTNGGGASRTWLGHGGTAAAVAGGSVTTTVTNLDFTVGGSGALSTVSNAANLLANAGSALTTAGNIEAAITAINVQMASLGSQAKALDIQFDFLTSLSDTVEKGIGNLVDADLAKESAKLQSLQIKQQLGAQALSIANQSPQVLLSLFRS